MTYKQFYKELAALKGKYQLVHGGMIRSRSASVGYCPIAGVNMKRGGSNTAYDTDKSRFKLRLSHHRCQQIMNAADRYELTPTTQKIRTNLLKAMGLKEVK